MSEKPESKRKRRRGDKKHARPSTDYEEDVNSGLSDGESEMPASKRSRSTNSSSETKLSAKKIRLDAGNGRSWEQDGHDLQNSEPENDDSNCSSPPVLEKEQDISKDVSADEIDDELEDIDCALSATFAEEEEWKPKETLHLLASIQSVLPSDDHVKYSTMADKLDWARIKVNGRSPGSCKKQWLCICTKLRRFRTTTELLVDAKNWAKQPWNSFGKKAIKHPDMPKKPLTPYFRFFVDKRVKYTKRHPDLNVTEITKKLSQKYQKLAPCKKQKYIDTYNQETEEWKASMIKFKETHPELFRDDDQASPGSNGSTAASATASFKSCFSGAPPKTTTAMLLYIGDKCREELAKEPSLSRKQLHERFRIQWATLTDAEKLPYIDKAIEAKELYDRNMTQYVRDHPEYKPREVKTFLSKAEQKIKDRKEGKPEKPPSNGYGLFTTETLPLLRSFANTERLGEVSRRWKKLSIEKKEAYNLKAEERNREYQQRYQLYVQNLPEDSRRRLEETAKQNLAKKKIQPPSLAVLNGTVPSERRMKPVAAVFLYIDDHRDEYKRKHPDLDDNEVQRQLVKEFNCLGDKEKAEYKHKETKAKELLVRESTPVPLANISKKGRRVNFLGEPPLPPHSGYQLFSKELLIELKHIESSKRLQEIGRRWAALSKSEKQKFNRRKATLKAQYLKDVEIFKKTLSAEELESFESLRNPVKSRKSTDSQSKTPQSEGSSRQTESEADDLSDDGEISLDADDDDDDKQSQVSQLSSDHDDDDDDDDEISESDNTESSSSDSADLTTPLTDQQAGEMLSAKRGKKLNAQDIYDTSSNASTSSSAED